jgi:hypothetical protein
MSKRPPIAACATSSNTILEKSEHRADRPYSSRSPLAWYKCLAAGTLLAAALLFARSAPASMMVIDVGTIFSSSGNNSSPAGTPPWLRATFDDHGSTGSVTLKLEAVNLTSNGSGPDEFATEWDFNVDPAIDPASLSFSAPTKVGTFTDPTINHASDNSYKADGDGKYDVQFLFETANAGRFGPNESVTYTITYPGLTAASFDFLSAPAGGSGPFYTAAHIQGMGPNAGASVWASEGGPPIITPGVPEPSTMVLGSIAFLVAIGAARHSRSDRRCSLV